MTICLMRLDDVEAEFFAGHDEDRFFLRPDDLAVGVQGPERRELIVIEGRLRLRRAAPGWAEGLALCGRGATVRAL